MNNGKEINVATASIVVGSVVRTSLTLSEKEVLEKIILKKLETARADYDLHLDAFKNSEGNDPADHVSFKGQEDGQKTLSKEENGKLAQRQNKFILSLEGALVRLKNGTYDGRCHETNCVCGNTLIPFERLKAAPHATKCCLAKEKSEKEKLLQQKFQKSRN